LISIPRCLRRGYSFGGGQFFSSSAPERQDVAIIFNQSDTLSVRVAEYYRQKRGIAAKDLIGISFDPKSVNMPPAEFVKLKAEVEAKTPKEVQFYALIWTNPYRVGCMSITSAFALGYDPEYCAEGCKPTKVSPYFDRPSSEPFTDFKLRPTMLIPTLNFLQARALVDRGVAADQTEPKGTAYLVSTSDAARNVRSAIYPKIVRVFGDRFKTQIIQSDVLENKKDVMFYFTGLERVAKLKTNQFLAGAITDHLTSFGGQLTDSSQMSSLEWLKAGATASYGTVVEPCNFPQKFPNPGIVLLYYLQGDRLIEAYWKSVEQPGQGIFIGEPLARPFSASSK
jgi:uncharacterized protein (TIGR03790 family)